MQIECARPFLLLLLPVSIGLILFFGRKLRISNKGRRIFMMALRILIAALVIGAMAGISIKKQSRTTSTIFVADLSDSLKSSISEESQFIKEAIQAMPEDNMAGIVVFGSDARIEQFVSEKKAFSGFQSVVAASATNLEQAVQTGLAMFPEGHARRLVLMTDGAENAGSLGNLAGTLAMGDTELKVVYYDSKIDHEVYVSSVDLPDKVYEGSRYQVKVKIYSTQAGQATVSLYSGKTLKDQKETTLQKGDNQLVFTDQGLEGGLKSYRVVVESDQDTVTINNIYSSFTSVEAAPKILVIEGSKGESKVFRSILEAGQYDYEVRLPGAAPRNINEMNQYKSILLLNVYAEDLREGFLDSIEIYVKDYAGSLIALGGDSSFALGGYKNTPLEKVLPVDMDLKGEKQIPPIAFAMVIDHSGSMSSPSTDNGRITCMDIAKNAAINALENLRPIDYIGVLEFDDSFDWAVPLQKMTDPDKVHDQIAGIQIRGGTSIYPAVREAADELKQIEAPLKHLILLTDGEDGFNDYNDLLRDLKEDGITLSTVAVGSGANTTLLNRLAQEGGGRSYYSDGDSKLPRIFAQEVYLSAKTYLINDPFVLTVVNSHEIIKGIFDEGCPSLLGYIASSPKASSTVILESDKEDPILTVWQYGLGRSVAWNSDGSGEWTGNFSGWEPYAALWRNIIDWSITDTSAGDDSLTVDQDGQKARIRYSTDQYDAATSVTALITDEEGKSREITIPASSPGSFETEVELGDPGIYSINLRNASGEKVIKNINTAAAIQYSREYQYADASDALTGFVDKAGGRYITKAQEVFDTKLQGAVSRQDLTNLLLVLAGILFMLDILIRRLGLNPVAIPAAIRQAARKRAKEKAGGTSAASGTSAAGGTSAVSGTYAAGSAAAGSPGYAHSSGQKTGGNVDKSSLIVDKPGSSGGELSQNSSYSAKKTDQEGGKAHKVRDKKGQNRKEQAQVIDTATLLKKKRDRQ